jgi:protein required for attachment to host cells
MQKLKIDKGEWVVVCDGKKALILENIGDEKFPNLHTRNVFEHDNPPTREQGADAPGRSFSSVGNGRSAMQQTDWHTQEEERFLRRVVGEIDAALTAGTTRSIVIVAPPRALGVIRDASSKRVKDALRAEVDKDYVRMPVHEIEKHLTGQSA